MALRVVFREKQLGKQYRFTMDRAAQRYHELEEQATKDAMDSMVRLTNADIAQAGRFGSRWRMRGEITRTPRGIEINMINDVPYFTVFQTGKVIHGRPLLWIPLSFAHDAQGVRARDYGPLFYVDRSARGKAPLLMSTITHQPKYFGKESVTLPKKFHVFEIIREVAKNIKLFFQVRRLRG